MQNIIFLKNTNPKNQIKRFLFCRPTDPEFFAVLPVDLGPILFLYSTFWLSVGTKEPKISKE